MLILSGYAAQPDPRVPGALQFGEFPKESAVLNRIVFNENYETSFNVDDAEDGAQADWYYVRVVQANGQLAWSSPIWVEKA